MTTPLPITGTTAIFAIVIPATYLVAVNVNPKSAEPAIPIHDAAHPVNATPPRDAYVSATANLADPAKFKPSVTRARIV